MSAVILVAETDPFNLRLLQEACEERGYRVLTSSEGEELLDVVARERPELIVLGADLAGIDGFGVLRILKADPALAAIPVLLATGADDAEGRRKGLELGAEDVLSKPYLVFEVQQRIRNVLRASQDLRDGELDAGVGTGSQLAISLDYEFTRAVRYRHSLACIVVRIRNHPELGEKLGPRWRAAMAERVRDCVRTTDQVYASEVDELTVLLPETDGSGLRVVLERMRRRLQEAGEDMPVSPVVGYGHAVYPELRADTGSSLRSAARGAIKDS